VHAGGGFVGEDHLGVDEPGRDQPLEVLGPGQGTGDAADVGAAFGPVGWGEVVLGDTSETPTRPPGVRTRNISAFPVAGSADKY